MCNAYIVMKVFDPMAPLPPSSPFEIQCFCFHLHLFHCRSSTLLLAFAHKFCLLSSYSMCKEAFPTMAKNK